MAFSCQLSDEHSGWVVGGLLFTYDFRIHILCCSVKSLYIIFCSAKTSCYLQEAVPLGC